jgi:uncharacterized protein GlcG (DUF336 family)
MITCAHVDSILLASKSKARDLGIAVCIVVMDSGGNLKALSRMDGAWLGCTDVALKKARTSVLFETETQNLAELCGPGGPVHGMELTNDGLITFAGGVPVQNRSGQLLGAIGVSGGMVDQDHEIARAGLAAIANAMGRINEQENSDDRSRIRSW